MRLMVMSLTEVHYRSAARNTLILLINKLDREVQGA